MKDEHINNQVAQLESDWRHDPNYYDNADSWVNNFWDKNTVFRSLFDRMNPENILEIACGRGRHTWQMRDWPNTKTTMDLVDENVDFCRKRFEKYDNINVIKGNGVDLDFAASDNFSAIFCYDAMVHFDHTIIDSYLREIRRVLKPGGMALLHHSNFHGNPGGDYKRNPHWRAFMPEGLFADYCAKSGLQVEHAADITWGEVENSDTVSLLKKQHRNFICGRSKKFLHAIMLQSQGHAMKSIDRADFQQSHVDYSIDSANSPQPKVIT